MSDEKTSSDWLTAAGNHKPTFYGGATGLARHYGGFDDRVMGAYYGVGKSMVAAHMGERLDLDDKIKAHGSWKSPADAEAVDHILWVGAHDGAGEPAVCDFSHLESYRSDVASLARFSARIDRATWYLSAAGHNHIDLAFWHRPSTRARPKSWLGALAGHCFSRWKTARNLLLRDDDIPEETTALYRTGFWSLCELTPADTQLKHLFEIDRSLARRELVKHVDAYAQQLTLATDLAEIMESQEDEGRQDVGADDNARLSAVQAALIEKAGGALTLSEAADRLGISRQAVHKKIGTHALLGVMVGDNLALPVAQFVGKAGHAKAVPHLREILRLFVEAGAGLWSAMQYLVEPDPALEGQVPLERMKRGDAALVAIAARAYLGLDEG